LLNQPIGSSGPCLHARTISGAWSCGSSAHETGRCAASQRCCVGQKIRHSRTRLSATRQVAGPNASHQRPHGEADRQRRVPLAAIIPSFLAGRTLFAVGCRLAIVALGALPLAQAPPPTPRGCDRFFWTPKSRCSRLACKAQPSFGVLVRARLLASRFWAGVQVEGDVPLTKQARPIWGRVRGFTPLRAEESQLQCSGSA
jgi:hypothetical protein